MNSKIDEDDAIGRLDEIDKEHGVNRIEPDVEVHKEQPQQVTSLGKPKSFDSTGLSAVEESPWKLLNKELLPSRGMFYPEGSEILLKSAKTKEIRHWSTMDMNDPIDVREKINFVLNACSQFKIKGKPVMFNYNDYCEIDRYHLLFRIYEITFPNQENKLFANIKCSDTSTCSTVNRIQVTSRNLKGFQIPEELLKWYSEEERCFVVPSGNLGETLRFYIPTVGMHDKFKNLRNQDIKAGREVDEAFYKYGPYMMHDWKRTSMGDIIEFKTESSNSWNSLKFNIVHKFTEALTNASFNNAIGVCEKCKKEIESRIFLRGSFTVKDIFIVSTGLDELIGA